MRLALLIPLLAAAGGCVERTLTITSEPSGALVEVNGEEFGRTPVTRDFTYYGKFDVTLRKEGYETLKEARWVVAPWWQVPPFDFAAELSPTRPRDRRGLSFTLEPTTEADVELGNLIDRAQDAAAELPATRPGDEAG